MTAARLREALQWLSDRGYQAITMDLAGVRRCDCAGVDALIASLHQVTIAHGQVLLTNPSDELRRLLGLSGQTPNIALAEDHDTRNDRTNPGAPHNLAEGPVAPDH